jgi:predicted alpha/beta hydrolase
MNLKSWIIHSLWRLIETWPATVRNLLKSSPLSPIWNAGHHLGSKVTFNPNSEVGTVLGSGAGFQPALSGKQGWKNLPLLPGGN